MQENEMNEKLKILQHSGRLEWDKDNIFELE